MLSRAAKRVLLYFVINWGGALAIVHFTGVTQEEIYYAVAAGMLAVAYLVDSRMNYHQPILLAVCVVGAGLLGTGFMQEFLKMDVEHAEGAEAAIGLAVIYAAGILWYAVITDKETNEQRTAKCQKK